MITYEWRGPFSSTEVSALHAEGFGHELADDDFEDHLRPFSFGSCRFRPTNAGLIAL